MKIARLLILVFFSNAAAIQAAKAVEPEANLTKAQAGFAFSSAVILTCLTRQERGGSIEDLPVEYRSDLTVAEGTDTRWPGSQKPTGDVWISRALGSHLRVATLGAQKCQIIADQLPVDDVLRKTQHIAEKLPAPFAPVQVKPGYNPIVYQEERTANGMRIVIHMEGAEPGSFGHASRFGLLIATVTSE